MLRQIILTAIVGLISAVMLNGFAAAGDLKTTVHSITSSVLSLGSSASGHSGTPGASSTGLPGDGLPNFIGLGSGDNGTSSGSDRLYVGSSSDGNGAYNIQIKKKILSF